MVKITTEEWIEKAKNIHGDKYDYSLVNYKGQSILIKIICLIHGEFEQTPKDHLSGCGCQKCSGKQKRSIDDFIKKANEIHNFKYNYALSNYVNNTTKVCIICPEHDEFYQTPKLHLKGSGCPQCGIIKRSTSRKSNFKDVINKMLLIHNSFYSYPEQDYINTLEKIKIICPKHGEFYQSTGNHLRGHGCPICNSSKGELLIYNWLKENNIPFKPQFELITDEIARNSNLMIIDFFVKYEGKQYFIEYDGIQHFEFNSFFHKTIEDFEKEQRRDKVLNEFCELHKDKITLIRFNYNESNEEIIKKLENIKSQSSFSSEI